MSKNNMYLLQNEIIYIENQDKVSYITEDEILNGDKNELLEKVRKSRLILFGGTGFAGRNESFNANDGIYRLTIDRNMEIQLSLRFEALYNRVEEVFTNKNLIIFTHMNINEWKKDYELQDHFIYVSGHSHLNTFYDDGARRLYADNQIGYYNDRAHLKYFLIDSSYDWFSEYDDGIYEITKKDYVEFYRGKNLQVRFNRDFNKLYMLKKSGYYSFIIQNFSGKLTMLNGGSLKALTHNEIDYYYQNMETEINYIKTPLSKFQEVQKSISNEIKKIGGNGRIHGAIIDIDGNVGLDGWSSIAYNHLYINPIDLTITPYYALNMIEKYVYQSVPALLRKECPKLFQNYKKLMLSEKNGIVIKSFEKSELDIKPVLYTSTDIYKASRELRKMQKLNSNILSTWVDGIPGLVDIPKMPQKDKVIQSMIGRIKYMNCGMNAEIIDYKNTNDISVKFEDGTIVEHVKKAAFDNHSIWNPSIEKPTREIKQIYKKDSYVGKTLRMNCGMMATVIEDFGCNDITVQFEDGLIRKHKRRDKFREGKIAHSCDD